jgi:hypothetical protein
MLNWKVIIYEIPTHHHIMRLRPRYFCGICPCAESEIKLRKEKNMQELLMDKYE